MKPSAIAQALPTVFVVDDDPSVRKGLTRLLNSAGYAVESFSSAQEFLDRVRHGESAGCVVLDVRMPGLSGLDLQRELKALAPPISIIFITGHGDIPMSVQAMKEGAMDFLAKPVHDEDLLRAVESARARNAAERGHHLWLRELQQRASTLTPREVEVMALVARGRLNKQVADELGTVEKTIKVHRARVMEKMKVSSLADLVLAAEKLGLLAGPTMPPASLHPGAPAPLVQSSPPG
jgi:FixJ family two-component response regulator